MPSAKQKITKWLKQYDIILIPGKTDEFHPHDKAITYSRRSKCKKKQIYSILHECGHHLIQDADDYEVKHKTQVEAINDGRKKRSLRWRIDYLKEEFRAWEVGKEIAEELDIEIDEKKYDDHAAFCLKSYCHWVLHPQNYKEEDI
jgi:hypothetical protein